MKKGLIISNQELGHNDYKIKRFLQEAHALGISLDVVINNGKLFEIEDSGEAKINLPKAGFVIYLDKDYYLAKTLETYGYRLFNKADFIRLCDDKILTYISCLHKDIRMIKTIPGPLFYSEKLNESNFDFLDTVIDELKFPLIMKRVYSSLGEGVYKISDKKELKELYTKYAKEALLFQEYISGSEGRSVRVLVIDKKVFGQYLRCNDKDFRSNYQSIDEGKPFENQEFMVFAEKIAEKLDIEYAGIDLLFDKDGHPIMCEINSNAFFEIFEKTTKKNVAKAFLEMIKKKI